jgi:hypothetical protein
MDLVAENDERRADATRLQNPPEYLAIEVQSGAKSEPELNSG